MCVWEREGVWAMSLPFYHSHQLLMSYSSSKYLWPFLNTYTHTSLFFPSPVVFLSSWCLSQSTHWHLYPLIPLAHTGLPRNVFYMMTAAKIWHLFNHSKKNIRIKKSHLMKIKRNQILSKYLCSYHINCNVYVFFIIIILWHCIIHEIINLRIHYLRFRKHSWLESMQLWGVSLEGIY